MKDPFQAYIWIFAIGQVSFLFAAILLVIVPVITRKELFFGVRIPESEIGHPLVRNLRKRYFTIMMVVSALLFVVGILVYLAYPQMSFLLILYQPLLLVLAQFFLYLTCWKHALRIKQEQDWRVGFLSFSSTNIASGKGRLKDMPYIWYVVCVFLIIAGILYGLYMYPVLPDILVKHWDINMKPDAWDKKSIGSVIALPLVSLGMVILMFASNAALYFTKLQVSLTNPVLSFAQHRQYRRMMTHALGFDTILITLLFLSMLPMSFNIFIPESWLMMTSIFIFTVLMLIPPIYVSVKAGQAGSRLKPVLSEEEMKSAERFQEKTAQMKCIDRGDDSLWKFGLFYYNPSDPSILVEDRFGSNGGLNYARPLAKVLAGILILLTIITYTSSTLLFINMP